MAVKEDTENKECKKIETIPLFECFTGSLIGYLMRFVQHFLLSWFFRFQFQQSIAINGGICLDFSYPHSHMRHYVCSLDASFGFDYFICPLFPTEKQTNKNYDKKKS